MKKRFHVKNALSDADGCVEMFLYGIIGDDLNCMDFVRELRDLSETNKTICIHINSGGGSVFDGLAIYGALKECKARTIGKIDGLCASMATVVALAMDEVYMCKTAQFMTHKASGWASGSADELKTYASMMDNLENVIADVYAKKTGDTIPDVKAKFLKPEDTWFSASDALSAKLIDGVYDMDASIQAPSMRNQKDLVSFYNTHIKNFNTANMKNIIMTAGQMAALNLSAIADAATVTSALDNVILKAQKVDQLQILADNAVAAKKTAEDALALLQSKATTDKVDALLTKALDTDKKITVAQKDVLRAQFLTNPEGLETFLKAMSPIVSVTTNLKEGGESKKFEGSWDVLDKAGLLDKLKAENLDLFKQKYKDHFGTEYSPK